MDASDDAWVDVETSDQVEGRCRGSRFARQAPGAAGATGRDVVVHGAWCECASLRNGGLAVVQAGQTFRVPARVVMFGPP